ncbi:MAG: polyprenyl synthetase family protein [Ruminococcus sp.]|nr:polyprenyl synthetase family protein [Ruminococcus sp.]MCD7800695.1 polyprenyl synthetase family protein [Ruminococcus sp.]
MKDAHIKQLKEYVNLVEDNLYRYLVGNYNASLEEDVISAMKYSLSAGGKRLRPVLVMEFCRILGGNVEKSLASACAIEMLHTSSLIHDDLPCMDDDDFRRGKPSCHKQFNEWLAVLAGDNLMVKPFEIIANDESISTMTRVKIISLLSKSTGFQGMIGGQVLDIQNETRENITEDILTKTCLEKTGALISCACQIGCLCAEMNQDKVALARQYAENIGLAFQIVDDILDVVGNQELLGKPIGSDQLQNKCTFVTLLGLEDAKLKAEHYTNKALSVLKSFPDNDFLIDLTNSLLVRNY